MCVYIVLYSVVFTCVGYICTHSRCITGVHWTVSCGICNSYILPRCAAADQVLTDYSTPRQDITNLYPGVVNDRQFIQQICT